MPQKLNVGELFPSRLPEGRELTRKWTGACPLEGPTAQEALLHGFLPPVCPLLQS